MKSICTVEACENVARCKDYCGKHYKRLQVHGDPNVVLKQKGVTKGWLNDQGYVILSMAGHPNAGKNGHIRQHIYLMSEHLGRPLLPGENVHHKNGVRNDNRLENLELWVTYQPAGQRPEDLVIWAKEILERYDS